MSKDHIVYTSSEQWVPERPNSLVVTCSDGRLQKSIDDFLSHYLKVTDYDRLYAPGGPAILSDNGAEFIRSHQFRGELEFLLRAHDFKHVVLILHGATIDGPEHSVCAHYRRVVTGNKHEDFIRRHEEDMTNVINWIKGISNKLHVQIFRAETARDNHVQFVELHEHLPAF